MSLTQVHDLIFYIGTIFYSTTFEVLSEMNTQYWRVVTENIIKSWKLRLLCYGVCERDREERVHYMRIHASNMTFPTFLLLPWGFPSVSKEALWGVPIMGDPSGLRDPWRGCRAERPGTAAALARSFARNGNARGMPPFCWVPPRQLDCCASELPSEL